MAGKCCDNCVYSVCDPELVQRWLWEGVPVVPRCANHPFWPGRLHDVPGVPCRNYRRKPTPPQGDNVRMIPLGDGFYAYVDAADYEWLNEWTWHMHSGCAARNKRGRTVLMHRQIMQPPEGMLVDHIDSNRANNCRSNLRICTRPENQCNKRKERGAVSQFKGVFFDKRYDKWYARCRYGGKYHALGYYDLEVDAARAYDRAAVLHQGEFARPNFPEEWPPERRAQFRAEHAATKAEAKKKGRPEAKKAKTPEARKPKAQNVKSRAETRRRRARKPAAKAGKSEGKRVRTREGKTP